MIRLKTAVLLAGSLKIGAIIGGASARDAEILYRFGEHIGIAFQLKDDLLDVYSDEGKFGKTTGGDIVANKKTFLYLKALELAGPYDYKALTDYFKADFITASEKVSGVKSIYNKLGIRDVTEAEMDKYYVQALKFLDDVDVEDSRKAELLKFANQLKKRDS
jgi:geranylgeranyl diphosphate synthase type II